MAIINSSECQSYIDEVHAYIAKHASKELTKDLTKFADTYLASCSHEDLEERAVKDWYAILLSHWEFIKQRKPGDAKIRIFNPDIKKDHWESTHTIIQISHDDVPFVVDSIRLAINRYGHQIHFIVHFGGLKVKRDAKHQLVRLYDRGAAGKDATSEAPIYIEIDRIVNKSEMRKLKNDIDRVLVDVRISVADWRKMVRRIDDCLAELESNQSKHDSAETVESRDFLRWLINNNFTFLGARDYKIIGEDKNKALEIVPGSGLGVLRDDTQSKKSKSYAELPPKARKIALSKKNILIIAKTNTVSSIHRDVYTDYIGVKRFDDDGEIIGERRFIGLYTSSAYHSSPRQIPFLRHKVDRILDDLGFPLDGHGGKEAVHILETLPRDDLFQGSHEELLSLTLNILQLKERRRVRLLVRRDAFNRYLSCLVYVPRDVFNTAIVQTIKSALMKSFNGIECSYSTYFSDSVLTRIHYNIRVNPKKIIKYELAPIEKQIIKIARTWSDGFKDVLKNHFGEAEGLRIFAKYKTGFSEGYKEAYSPLEALGDIIKVDELSDGQPITMLIKRAERGNGVNLKLFHTEDNVVLSDVLPILENMGLRIIGERPHKIYLGNGKHIWVNDFSMTYSGIAKFEINHIKDVFQEAFTNIWVGNAENDGFNQLVLEANLTWQETAMLRAYTKYLRQTGFTFSQRYIAEAMVQNNELAKALVQLFLLRFDPQLQNNGQENQEDLVNFIVKSLDDVSSLDEDRIIRRLLEVIQATIRTNFFQLASDKTTKPYLSLKLDPSLITDMPLPKPKFEIFVYSPRVEGVHLRGGKVARGGLRWSDRREDFRTEVLGLMKAQQVKNTVIVPEGAKGGFVVKTTYAPDVSRDEFLAEGIECYSMFISGLLDITDNLVDGKVVPPKDVVRYDEDDTYLVVAADKGTATFSDIANGIAEDYGFWMGDAFASGGSAGYDHKKMGITSKGAWVSVMRHFRELGMNLDTDEFSVVGIGDMGGDVFGNGMLLSKHIKLIGAFNHMHIFVDPNPDTATSYKERKRLFKLPRSSWSDYNTSLISTGGGVFKRSAKSIKLSPEMKVALGIKKDSIVPNELIRALLKSEVDLIWNGGIGTFVKSSKESDIDVGDRSNDAIRINAPELRARVVGEGGNLGMTQLARIEYSLNDGIVNTDFIDNSAGVDCSDHEVNIKILLNRLVANGTLDLKQRNIFLEKMTDEIAELVLDDNYQQTQMLSLEKTVAHQTMDLFRYYMNDLEKRGRLNRELEHLPTDAELMERRANNKPLTRPEIAMLLAYCKMYLKQDILSCDMIDEPFFEKYLLMAFPEPVKEKYLDGILQHSLRREIIATQLCKSMTDRMGINFVDRLQRETGASLSFIIRSFVIAENIFEMEDLWKDVAALDYEIDSKLQYKIMLQIYFLIRKATRWILRNRQPKINIQETVDEFRDDLKELVKKISKLIDKPDLDAYNAEIASYTKQGISSVLAKRIAACDILFTSLDVIEGAKSQNLDLDDVAKTYYILGNRLELNWLRQLMEEYNVDNQWDELARAGFRDDLDQVQRQLSISVMNLQAKPLADCSVAERVDIWIQENDVFLTRWEKLLADIRASDTVGFVTYSVVLRELFDFSRTA